MNAEYTHPRGWPIRVDDLRPGDQVILFGAVVEIRDLVRHPDFPTTRHVTIQRRRPDAPPGAPAGTLLPEDLLLAPVWVPRDVHLACLLCHTPMQLRQQNLADGVPRRVLCGTCANPDATAVLPRMPRAAT